MAKLDGYPIASLGMPSTSPGMEPSGLAIMKLGDTRYLFMVSDNGGMAKSPLPGSDNKMSWLVDDPPASDPDKLYDFESVTVADGQAAWTLVGREGYRPVSGQPDKLTSPVALRYDASSTTSCATAKAQSWNLMLPADAAKSNQGMEGMTWVPPDAIPSAWGLDTDDTIPLFVAVQSVASTIYVMLPSSKHIAETQVVAWSYVVAVPQPSNASGTALISDLFYDTNTRTLFALYDGGASADYLQALRFNSSGELREVNSTTMPWKGCEGVAVFGEDLYFCTDDNKSSGSNDGVYLVRGFIPPFLG